MEAVTSQCSRGELSIMLFQLAYNFITSERRRHLSESPLMDFQELLLFHIYLQPVK